MDILGLIKDQLTSAAISKISGVLGESSQNTSSALGSAMPAILGGLMQKASTTEGAGSILDIIKNDNHDGSIFDNLSSVLDGGNSKGLISNGTNLLGSIFGDKVGGLVNIISKVSGLGSGSTTSLLGMAAPMLMGLIGKQVKSQGMGVSGLTNLLMSQKDSVKAALPAGMGSLLNIDGLGDFLGSAKSTSHSVKSSVNEVVEESKSGFGKFWPWLLIGALLLGSLYFWKTCKNDVKETANAIDSTATSIANSVDSSASAVAGSVKKTLSTGFELNFGEKSIENDLITFIEDKDKAVEKDTWFNFRNLKFQTGSSNIDSTSMMEVNNIAEIMKAYPGVNIKIGGYTDNVGSVDSNMKLSSSRANNVMASLIAKGIEKTRISSEGYGPQHPIASNDTEEGKAQNRRIAVKVTRK